ncbi:hypothetical protein C0Q70_13821 [Pomacea canaliculata]|uniref:Uncharacterized protein n=1 Tax=Pomacea canaliculata TaxID=400727 RepID=A0A2T7NYA7_POMCA|nr:hypothetical protein C0Q70_13821 [Pomacea canaliculata]
MAPSLYLSVLTVNDETASFLIDLGQPLEAQGPFDAIVHKVTDILAKADNGNKTAQKLIHNIQNYTDRHPECILLDPLESTRQLLDRYKQYQQVCTCDLVQRDSRVIIPTFVELTSSDVEENKQKLAKAGVTFPIGKILLLLFAVFQMAIIFSEESLRDVKPPCVAQSFLNHNALLYKIFVVGNRQFVVQRPSLKNLYPGNYPTIFFDTQEVSKPDSSHPLNEVDMKSIDEPLIKPDWQLLEQLGAAIGNVMELRFEGVDDFFSVLLDYILEVLGTKENCDRRADRTPTSYSNDPSSTKPVSVIDSGSTGDHHCTIVKTATVNAVNLKASQKFFVDQSCRIDCTPHSLSDPAYSHRGASVVNEDVSERSQMHSQLQHKNNLPSSLP